MKTAPDCLACFLQQALRVARLEERSPEKEVEVIRAVAELLPGFDFQESPPANAIRIYDAIAEATGRRDPYFDVKRQENRRAFEALPAIRTEIASASEPLMSAIGFAIAANIIDYGAAARFDVSSTFMQCREMNFVIDHRQSLLAAIKGLGSGSSVLYLADNCGEIVYDSLVVELLARRGFDVTVAVRGGPIINDALVADAEEAGIGAYARIITNGVACPGTPLALCSEELHHRFVAADLVISKGQGNFETLSETNREIFFLLTVKCRVVAEHLNEKLGLERALSGNGELVVYYYEYDESRAMRRSMAEEKIKAG